MARQWGAITVQNISKAYGIEAILKDISFTLNPGDRLGLVGANGCGKTTLLRILTGHEVADQGAIRLFPSTARIGYLPQGLQPGPTDTVGSFLGLDSVGEAGPVGDDPAEQVARLASEMATAPTERLAALQQAYDAALDQLQAAVENTRNAPQVLQALGLDHFGPEMLVAHLSGGQKTRLALASVLLNAPQILLLDEPTNHLDIAMLEWLEDWLNRFEGALLIVSHDRAFLDHVANGILELDLESHTLRKYSGNYTAYVEQVEAEHERQLSAYQDQVYEIRRMKQDIQRTKQQALHVELTTTSRQPGVRRIAKKVARKAKSRERRLERYLNSDERVEKPGVSWQIQKDFFTTGEPIAHQSQAVLVLESLAVGYPGSAALLKDLNLNVHLGQRIALVGPNGSGKTTLVRTIAGKLAPLAGSVRLGSSVRLGYMAQEQEVLEPGLNSVETLQRYAPVNETEARTFLHKFLFSGDDVFTPVGSLSYGERARLMLGILVAQGCTFLLLDEPINHLDIPSRTRFEQALANFEGTVLAVVHDRYFIEGFASDLWVVEQGGVQVRG